MGLSSWSTSEGWCRPPSHSNPRRVGGSGNPGHRKTHLGWKPPDTAEASEAHGPGGETKTQGRGHSGRGTHLFCAQRDCQGGARAPQPWASMAGVQAEGPREVDGIGWGLYLTPERLRWRFFFNF